MLLDRADGVGANAQDLAAEVADKVLLASHRTIYEGPGRAARIFNRLGQKTECLGQFRIEVGWPPLHFDGDIVECFADRDGQADVVIIHVILSKRTRGLVGAGELALMKLTSWLINTSRGPIVDEGALVHALTSRAIAGATLDVFGAEPLPKDHPFRALDNALATPHIGYVAEDLYRTFYSDAAISIGAWLDETANGKEA